MSELLSQPKPKAKTANERKADISPEDAVRLVINTAVIMTENEPAIDVRSVTESIHGEGVLIWIPGYIWRDGQIVVSQQPAPVEAAP